MRLPSPPRIPVVSREDKEARLKAFIAEALTAHRERSGENAAGNISLVARAPDSPVAKAVLAMAGEIAAANVTVRVVLFESEALSEDAVQPSLVDVGAIEIRMLGDQRFASAHEQLALGFGRVWIGDCMRRDPGKRDAFEMYHTGHDAISGHADASFAKLWHKSTALSRMLPTSVPADVLLAGHPLAGTAPLPTRR